MKNLTTKFIIKFIFIILLIYSQNIFAAPTITTKTNKLHAITKKISDLKKHLFLIRHKRNHIKTSLKSIELNISFLAKKMDQNKNQLLTQHKQLKKINTKQRNYQQQLKIQKKLLARHIYTAYILGRQPYIKIILNQEDPTKISRYLYYCDQFNQARLQIIHNIENLTKKFLFSIDPTR